MMRGSTLPGVVALALHIGAAIAFALLLDGYSHREFPLALLGAQGMPRALVFNLCAFVLPGMLATVAMWRLRSVLPADARWPSRIGTQLMALSGLAFAAQGLLPLDPGDVGAASNAMHALAWTLWWIAGTSGALLLAWAVPLHRLRVSAAVAVVAIPFLALPPWPGALAAFAPRAAFVAWLLWIALASRFSRA